jgi:predicted O-linked N-acetylglucosamine transferase (SPINDLY family)
MSLPLPSSNTLAALYGKKDFAQLNVLFLQGLKHFNDTQFSSLSREDQLVFDDYIASFLYIFTQPDFIVTPDYELTYVNLSHLIANLVAMSCFSTADGHVRHLLSQDKNLVRFLALMTCYNDIAFNQDLLFEANAPLASLWWFNQQTAPPGTFTQAIHDRCVKQLQNLPKKLELIDLRTAPLYFQSTYFEADREIKLFMNKQLQKKLEKIRISNNPRKNSIALVSGRWQPTTAVYKSCFHQIEALSKKYDLTLIKFGGDSPNHDLSLFKAVKNVRLRSPYTSLDASELKANDFQLVYFPDIGMTYESVCLANMRLAPIMVTGYGHPVSTFGSHIDYFIGGEDAELPLEESQKNYSEKLILIPGIGAHPVFPNYTRKRVNQHKFYINCCWTTAKINYPMLEVLKEIQQRATKEIIYQFFPSWTVGRYQNAIPFMQGLASIFGERAIAHENMSYHEYLEKIEQAQFSLDSYPFGGYNTIVDSLFVGCPVVTLEGDYFYNRASSAVMRKIGVTDLITRSKEDYIKVALRLIDDTEYCIDRRNYIDNLDLRSILVDNNEPAYFVKAIDDLIAKA